MAWEVPGLNIAATGQLAGNRVAGLFGDFQNGLQANDEQQVRGARRSLSDLGVGPDGKLDLNAASQRLLAAGDIKGAQALADLGLAQEDRAFRQMQYQQGQQVATDNQNYQRSRDGIRDQQFERTLATRETRLSPQEEIQAQIDGRIAAAERIGLKPDNPGYQSYIATGKMPREDAQPLTATDKKAILEADEGVAAASGGLALIKQAQEISPKAYSGATAGARAAIGNNLPDWLVPDFIASPKASEATANLNAVTTEQALSQLKSIFGGAPTEGERGILMEISGAANQPEPVRKAIYERARQAVQRRLEFANQKSGALRGNTYYQPGGGQPQAGAGAPQPEAGPEQAPQSNENPSVGTRAQYEALPSGAVYLDTRDNTVKRKR